MDNYPLEETNDSLNNQPLTEPYKVTVSITLSKTFTVDVIKHEDRLVNEADVRLQHFLPDEILKTISKLDTKYKKALLNKMKSDASDWIVDDIAIVEE